MERPIHGRKSWSSRSVLQAFPTTDGTCGIARSSVLVVIALAVGCTATQGRRPRRSLKLRPVSRPLSAGGATSHRRTSLNGVHGSRGCPATYGFSGKRPRRDPNDLPGSPPTRTSAARRRVAIVSPSKIARARRADREPRVGTTDDAAERTWTSSTVAILLTASEKALLKQNGFVVPARLALRGYADALHDVYQSQLPIFISADAVMHGIYKGNDSGRSSRTPSATLLPRLATAIQEDAQTDPTTSRAVSRQYVHDDVALYFAVARARSSRPRTSTSSHSACANEHGGKSHSTTRQRRRATGGLQRR